MGGPLRHSSHRFGICGYSIHECWACEWEGLTIHWCDILIRCIIINFITLIQIIHWCLAQCGYWSFMQTEYFMIFPPTELHLPSLLLKFWKPCKRKAINQSFFFFKTPSSEPCWSLLKEYLKARAMWPILVFRISRASLKYPSPHPKMFQWICTSRLLWVTRAGMDDAGRKYH